MKIRKGKEENNNFTNDPIPSKREKKKSMCENPNQNNTKPAETTQPNQIFTPEKFNQFEKEKIIQKKNRLWEENEKKQ